MADADPDAMVIVAALVSRVEALVVASMLEAGGIDVTIGAVGHTSVALNSLALGGHRLWVPEMQHLAASNLLLEVLGNDPWSYCYGLQRAILWMAALWGGIGVLTVAIGVWFGTIAPLWLIVAPLNALTLPTNPQARGDYYLAAGARYPGA